MKTKNLIELNEKIITFFELSNVKLNETIKLRKHLLDLDFIDLRILILNSYKIKLPLASLLKCSTSYDIMSLIDNWKNNYQYDYNFYNILSKAS